MKNTMLAILAVALAALAPFAMAAEGQGDNDADGNKQPTMAELGNKVDSIVRQLGSLSATTGSLRTELGALATTVGTLASTVSANHTTIVGKFAQQMAVVMAVPRTTAGGSIGYYLVGDSTIPGFPTVTVAANGYFTGAGSRTLPAGTYLFELQQPYSDDVLCQSSVSRRKNTGVADGARFVAVCPRLRVNIYGGQKLDDGFGIYTFGTPSPNSSGWSVKFSFPTGLTFTDDKPLASYTGAVRITKLK